MSRYINVETRLRGVLWYIDRVFVVDQEGFCGRSNMDLQDIQINPLAEIIPEALSKSILSSANISSDKENLKLNCQHAHPSAQLPSPSVNDNPNCISLSISTYRCD